jgi:hypothetical protein
MASLTWRSPQIQRTNVQAQSQTPVQVSQPAQDIRHQQHPDEIIMPREVQNNLNQQMAQRDGVRLNKEGRKEVECKHYVELSKAWVQLSDKQDLSSTETKSLDLPPTQVTSSPNTSFKAINYISNSVPTADVYVKLILEYVLTYFTTSNTATINHVFNIINSVGYKTKPINQLSMFEFDTYNELIQLRAGLCMLLMRRKAHKMIQRHGADHVVKLLQMGSEEEKNNMKDLIRYAVIGVMSKYLTNNINLFPDVVNMPLSELENYLAFNDVKVIGHGLYSLCRVAVTAYAYKREWTGPVRQQRGLLTEGLDD